MPRVYKRKTRREVDESSMKRALRDHFKNKIPIREVSRNYDIKRSTLMSRIKKIKQNDRQGTYENSDSGLSDDEGLMKFQNKHTNRQVFTTEEENDLVSYIKKCSDCHYGLSYRQIRELAYEYAIANRCSCPESWKENKIAGELSARFSSTRSNFKFDYFIYFRFRLALWFHVEAFRFIFENT